MCLCRRLGREPPPDRAFAPRRTSVLTEWGGGIDSRWMPRVDFSDTDATELLGVLRDRVRRSGYAFVDDSALQVANAGADPAKVVSRLPPERERLWAYLNYVIAYFDRNSQAAYYATLAMLNEQLGPRSEGIAGVRLEVPQGTGFYPSGQPVALEHMLVDKRSLEEFRSSLRVIQNLITEGWLPDPPDPGPPGT